MSEQRRRLSPAERRAQIIAIGVNELVDHPLEHITVERIATLAGVSRGLIFHYFGSLPGLRHAVVVTARDALVAASYTEPDLPPYERLRETLERLIAFVEKHPRTFYALVRGSASADPDVREAVDEARDVLAERVMVAFAEVGLAATPQLHTVMRAWISFAEETIVEATQRPEVFSAPELVDLLERSALAVASVTSDTAASVIATLRAFAS